MPIIFGNNQLDAIEVIASRDLLLNDMGRTLVNTTVNPVVLTLTTAVDAATPIGTELTLRKQSTGNITFTPTAPTVINGTTTLSLTTAFSSMRLRKVAADLWVTI